MPPQNPGRNRLPHSYENCRRSGPRRYPFHFDHPPSSFTRQRSRPTCASRNGCTGSCRVLRV